VDRIADEQEQFGLVLDDRLPDGLVALLVSAGAEGDARERFLVVGRPARRGDGEAGGQEQAEADRHVDISLGGARRSLWEASRPGQIDHHATPSRLTLRWLTFAARTVTSRRDPSGLNRTLYLSAARSGLFSSLKSLARYNSRPAPSPATASTSPPADQSTSYAPFVASSIWASSLPDDGSSRIS